MNISPDYLIERKRNKAQLIRWKGGAIVLFMFIIILLFQQQASSYNFTSAKKLVKNEYIASILIEDVIDENSYRISRLKDIAEDHNIKAVIVNINSPGGSVVASEKLYDALKKISAKKPVVTLMGSVAASGGYLVALGGDHMMAHNGTITGSIGVIMQSAEATELAEKIGIKFENFKSSELKAAPNPTEKVTPEVRKAMMENIEDVYQYFIELVAKRRKLDIEFVKNIADGRIYTGRQALKIQLIDEVGNEENAVKWLVDEKKLSADLKVIEVKLRPKDKLFELLLEDLDIKIRSFFTLKFKGMQSRIG